MIFSYNWLQTYIKDDLPAPAELARTLTLHAYEVEGVEEKGDDYVLDIDVLPDRASDSLSYVGVAREIAALFDLEVDVPVSDVAVDDSVKTSQSVSLDIDSPDVRRATKRLVRDVQIGESPDWLKKRLAAVGQRSINNVVDITNFVMLETGQPVHAFDYNKIKGQEKKIKEITIRGAQPSEKITTLDGNEFELEAGMLVIADKEKPLDIAGIKGGDSSGIDEDTTDIVLSVCSFDPVSIRRTSRALGLRTDASKRFENNVPLENVAVAMERLSELIASVAGGRVSPEVLDVGDEEVGPQMVEVSTALINKRLGTQLTPADVEDVFHRLQFTSELKDDMFAVTVPWWRTDIEIAEDLIEEVGRVWGYDEITSMVPEKRDSVEVNKAFYTAEKARDVLVQLGFNEVMTYAFREAGEVAVTNPIAEDKKFLRPSLAPGLQDALELNEKNTPLLGLDTVRLFEIGTVFSAANEQVVVGIAASGKDRDEAVEAAVSELERVLDITLEADVTDGFVGIPLAEITDQLSSADSYGDLADINLGDLQVEPISRYPFVLRDIAVWIPADTPKDELVEVIQKNAGDLLVNMGQFDEYEKDDRVSYAYRLVFQASDRSLTDEEVNEVMAGVTEALEKKSGFEVR